MKFEGNKMVKVKIFITGGVGFIGSHLVETLIQNDCEITIIDNFSTRSIKNLEGIDKSNITVIHHGIEDYKFINELIEKVNFDYVYLLGAVASVAATIEYSIGTHDVNLNANLHILQSLRQNYRKKQRLFLRLQLQYMEIFQHILKVRNLKSLQNHPMRLINLQLREWFIFTRVYTD